MIRSYGEDGYQSESDVEAHVAGQVAECATPEWEADPERMREVARAVNFYVTVDQGAESVDSRSLTLLTSQALASIGDTGVARRLLVRGVGLMKPAVWEIRRGREMWTLDLRQIALEEGAGLELVLFGSLAALLRGIAEIWDAAGGRGVLGIRNIDVAAGVLVGQGARREKRVTELAGEITRWCRHVMERLRVERGWGEAPEVISLEL